MKFVISKISLFSGLLLSWLLIGCSDLSLPNDTEAVNSVHFSDFEAIKDSSGETVMNPITGEPYYSFGLEVEVNGEKLSIEWMSENLTTKANPKGLFTHEVAMTQCPSGWRLPNDDDWRALVLASGLKYEPACIDTKDDDYKGTLTGRVFPEDESLGVCLAYAGDWLKSEQGWGGFEGSNRLHFGALPEGYLDLDGTHRQEGEYAYFWSSDSVETSLLNSNNNSKSSWYFTKSIEAVHQENNEQLGLAVRCVKSK